MKTLRAHVDDVHAGVETRCEFCLKKFLSKEGLQKHVDYTHPEMVDPNVEAPQCEQCVFKCYGNEGVAMKKLKRHQQNKHIEEINRFKSLVT